MMMLTEQSLCLVLESLSLSLYQRPLTEELPSWAHHDLRWS